LSHLGGDRAHIHLSEPAPASYGSPPTGISKLTRFSLREQGDGLIEQVEHLPACGWRAHGERSGLSRSPFSGADMSLSFNFKVQRTLLWFYPTTCHIPVPGAGGQSKAKRELMVAIGSQWVPRHPIFAIVTRVQWFLN
jgi:hypothetical protein